MALIRNLSVGIQVKHQQFKNALFESGDIVNKFSSRTKAALNSLAGSLREDSLAAKEFGTNAQSILNGIAAKAGIASAALGGIAQGGIANGQITKSFIGMRLAIASAGQTIDNFKSQMDVLHLSNNKFSNIAKLFTPIDNGLILLSKGADRTADRFKKMGVSIANSLRDVINKNKTIRNFTLSGLLNSLIMAQDAADKFKTTFPKTVAVGVKAIGLIKENRFLNQIVTTFQGVKAITDGTFSAMYGIIRNRMKSIVVAVEAPMTRVVSIIRNGMRSIGSTVSAVTSTIAGSINTIIVPLTALGAAFVTFSIKAAKLAATAEQTEIAFQTLFGGIARGNKALKELKTFADVTPFNTEEVIQAGKQLKAFGFNAADIIPTMTRIGDVSAGLSIDINRLTTTYGKAKVAGTLYAADINEFINAGVPIITELSKVMKVNENQVKKLGSEGKISFGILEQAFINMTSNGGQFAGLMEKQSKSLAGVWSNLTATIERITTKIGKGIARAFDLTNVVNKVNNFANSFEKYLPLIEGFYVSIRTAIVDFSDAAISAFDSVGLSANDFVNIFKRISFTIRSATKGIQLSWLTIELASVQLFNKLTYWLTEAVPAAFKYLAKNGFQISKEMFENILRGYQNLAENIRAVWKNIGGIMRGTVKFDDVWKPLSDGFKSTVENFVLPERVKGDLEGELESMIGILTDNIQKDMNDVWNPLVDNFDNAALSIKEKFEDIFDGAVNSKIATGIEKMAKDKLSSIAAFASNLITGTQALIGDVKKPDEKQNQSTALFGSLDAIKLINQKAIDPKKETESKKQTQLAKDANKMLDKMTGFLGTLVNNQPAPVDI